MAALYLIEILHQTTTKCQMWSYLYLLYLIEILHQTTTAVIVIVIGWSCILLKFYIKPQHNANITKKIKRCILLKFYIKPQPVAKGVIFPFSCILLKFYIKPQPRAAGTISAGGCILLKFYIKPQLARQWLMVPCVVSYWNSTSNHNSRAAGTISAGLYLIEILHQTTTILSAWLKLESLYLIEILHQTTTPAMVILLLQCCILLKFYIKPQLGGIRGLACRVVSYWNSTSNHNCP